MGRLVLIGLPGSGKTTLGKRLAERLGLTFFDSDWEVEASMGCSIPEIFARWGEAFFRLEEMSVLEELCLKPSCVIATGGGAVLMPQNRELLRRHALVAFLDVPPESIAQRVSADGRPLLYRFSIQELARQRRELYLSCAHVVLPAEGAEEAAVAAYEAACRGEIVR